ncbi:MAG: non-homologous end-joining DNA ligase [Acidimicrobiia bacterium]|nr:non-homologous end-joining DNA ligase [Acidimicrobiia bacterium]
MAATLLPKGLPSPDESYAYEFKWDGVRALTYVRNGEAHVESRNLLDVTGQYPEVAGVADKLAGRTAVLDGEIVALAKKGRPSFQLLPGRMHIGSAVEVQRRMVETPVAYLVFDVLYLDGNSTMRLPYTERREVLESLPIAGPCCQIPPTTFGNGEAVVEASKKTGLEGVMAKRVDSIYEVGKRSRAWLKVKNHRGQEFVIGGWSTGEGRRAGTIGALLLGYYDADGKLLYAGHVGTGFTDKLLAELQKEMAPLTRPDSPFDTPVARVKNATFVEPKLVGEVQFAEWTREGTLRQPSFKGLREDKDPRKVVREEAPEQ